MSSGRLTIPDDPREAYVWLTENGYTDGLPVVPPQEPLVAEYVARSGRGADEVVGQIPPAQADLTVEACATNAVMAGLPAELMPLLLEVVEAVLAPEFSLAGVQATTHPAGVAVLISGPAAARFGLVAGSGVLGPGHRTNMTLGRALRLVLMNVGGARPGLADMSTFGSPAKLHLVAAELQAGNPWPSFASRTTGTDGSTVTVLPVEGPHNINDHFSRDAEGIARSLASSLAAPGSNDFYYEAATPVLLLSPEHVTTLADEGWDAARLSEYLYEHSIAPEWFWGPANIRARFTDRDHDQSHEPVEPVIGPDGSRCYRMLSAPERVQLFVCGGPGKHSVVLPTFGQGVAVTRQLRVDGPL